jgi:hypothetical protein
MAVKFNRNYTLEAQLNDGTLLTISYPLTLDFSITRQAWSSTNRCQFRVKNLNPVHRQQIFRDQLDLTDFRSLKLSAGYGPPPWPQIFNGNVNQAYSFRESGSTDFITEWLGWDFGYPISTAFSNVTLAGPVSHQQVVNQLCNDLVKCPMVQNPNMTGGGQPNGLAVGYVSNFDDNTNRTIYPRGRTLFGNSWQLLQREVGGCAFIENGQINILQNSDVRGGGIPNIDYTTGLLSPPRRTETYLDVDLLFSPGLYCGQLVNLTSQSSGQFNGQHQILGITHKGIISGAVNGKCVTTLRLFYKVASSTSTGTINSIANPGLPNPIPVEGVLG